MAEAEEQGLTARADLIAEVELSMPVMPHIAMRAEELNKHYPALVPPAEVDDPDPDAVTMDQCYTHGLKVASQIAQDMVQLGRTRKEGTIRSGIVDTGNGGAEKVVSSAEGSGRKSHQAYLTRIGTSERSVAETSPAFALAEGQEGIR